MQATSEITASIDILQRNNDQGLADRENVLLRHLLMRAGLFEQMETFEFSINDYLAVRRLRPSNLQVML